ncbi:V-type proton ATPase subunit S1-like [Polypterus senegalus]|uniref:V-type proton ATPase subunit S1-like n=1 Tax=Polypterus senegalus TaxID=55291 RepID=UPI00196659E7|nr:V-type proton ATPase subunit S1-like [Polypterus senegalus]
MRMWKAIFICVFGTNFWKASCAVEQIPLLIWSLESSVWQHQAYTYEGHITTEDELKDVLQPLFKQNNRNIVLFLQDQLSLDDFNSYATHEGNAGPFQNLQKEIESSASHLILPAVNWRAAAKLPQYLQEKAEWQIFNVEQFPVKTLEANLTKPSLFIVKLPATGSIAPVLNADALAKNDHIMKDFISLLQASGIQYTAMFTASQPSVMLRSSLMTYHTGRQLMAVSSSDPVAFPPLNITNGTNTCIIFYATNLTLTANRSIQIDLTNFTFVANMVNYSASKCNESNAVLSLNYMNPTSGINNLELRFLMSNSFYSGSARNWFTVDSFQILQDSLNTAVFNVSMSVPAEYSYSCQMVGTNINYGSQFIPTNAQAKTWMISITDFQIQGFNIQGGLFSYASDCSSFFSPFIWMALVTAFVLLCVLAYGMLMIMQLTTNERFDDPKGHALSVPQNE